MNEEQTALQKAVEQLNKKMTRIIVKAIKNGAKYKTTSDGGLYLDEVYITPKFSTQYRGLILDIDAPEIDNLFKPSREQIEEQLKVAEEDVSRIKNQLKQYDNETNND